MSFGILLAVLGSAFLHALWNALIKTGTSRLGAMIILSIGEVPIGLAVAAFCPLPAPEVWKWVLMAGCAHFFYKSFLTYAYDHGDLSRVYPIARGAAPLIVAIFGTVLLADRLTLHEFAGIAILGLGILLMAQGIFSNGENRKMLPYALGSACATATYTMLDGTGARVAGDAIAYVAWVFVADGLLFSLGMLTWKGLDVLPRDRKAWGSGLLAAAASYGAYGVSVWAMTKAPIAVVAAVRETSILFAVLIGWLVFGEKMTRGKALAACVIVSGVILTRL
ncbi:MAG: DMT family permease [Rhodobacteraceae bacterium]|uniref:DMT family transporter n=1 Tax=Cypionkella sp. TaxID=2811411 RepID=UPI00132989EB|nr:DMT family transporter [Cypionkella sp.]KAF0171915.1 MAG: DMT family permease [Paracoccaceae bacterium]MDO8328344.1 DMT family transporter [Cypionkella sp.]